MFALAESPVPPTLVGLAGTEVLLDASGALFWPDERVLVVADMHLEKGSAFARRGQMLPPFDTRETLARLAEAVRRLDPRTVIALGDSLHDRWADERMDGGARAAIAAIQQGRSFIWIAGNHDPAPHGLGGECAGEIALGPLVFRHEPAEGTAAGEVCGHLHPVARIARAGRSMRRRCFATDGRRMVLPAFGAYAGGLNVRHAAVAGLFPPRAFAAHLLGVGRTYRLPAAACLED